MTQHVEGGADHLDARIGAEDVRDRGAHGRRIVDDERADRHGFTFR